MAFGIYKPGQGYWVRVLTATIAAIITLATAVWVSRQLGVVGNSLPRSAWTVRLGTPQGSPQVGQTVTLLGAPDGNARAGSAIGTARVDSFEPVNDLLTISDVKMTSDSLTPTAAHSLRADGTTPFSAPVRNKEIAGIAFVEPELLQAIGAAAVLAIGALIAWYFAASKPGSVDFLISTDSEMKKVNWSTWKDIKGSTIVVIGACFLISIFLFGTDVIFQMFFQAIGVLVQ